ncbi:hypothetical protein PsYK624_042780 [Phanerochaete sordida]|uniref:Uncharacterized protein n=1 Tax=Phanerochaete sordida TaxID=48140 RepID=A0A9P3LAH7_9APHY|nr:hypothetical protein PsYK624_042780 [Phanerochaete sordida]
MAVSIDTRQDLFDLTRSLKYIHVFAGENVQSNIDSLVDRDSMHHELVEDMFCSGNCIALLAARSCFIYCHRP